MPERSDKQKTREDGVDVLQQQLHERGASLQKTNRAHFEVVTPKSRRTIRIKCSNGFGWQMSLTQFVKVVEKDGWDETIALRLDRPDVVYVFVWLGARQRKPNRFFMLAAAELQEVVRAGHQWWLNEHGGKRPIKPESVHHDVRIPRIEQFENRWSLLGVS